MGGGRIVSDTRMRVGMHRFEDHLDVHGAVWYTDARLHDARLGIVDVRAYYGGYGGYRRVLSVDCVYRGRALTARLEGYVPVERNQLSRVVNRDLMPVLRGRADEIDAGAKAPSARGEGMAGFMSHEQVKTKGVS